MEVSTSPNISQSLALAAYSTQQQQPATRSRDGDRDNETVDANRNTEPRRGDNVSFSQAALQLSAQDNGRNTVNKPSESDATKQQLQQEQQAANPETVRAAGAKSVAQAINAYRDASVI